jgi:hypothetical protein
VKGVVLDEHEARINTATITIEGSGIQRLIKTNELGEYEFDVPNGIYQIRAEVPNYYAFKRAAFRVKPNTVRIVNIVPVQRVLSIGLEATLQGEREQVKTAPPAEFESLKAPNPGEPSLEIVVRFQKRETDGEFVQYRGASLTYDAFTIYADRIRLDKRTLNLEASGKLIVEDGEHRIHATSIRASLKEHIVDLTFTF